MNKKEQILKHYDAWSRGVTTPKRIANKVGTTKEYVMQVFNYKDLKEDLTNIRFTSKRRSKKFKTKLGRWSFADLRAKLEYKALLNGVKLVVVDPRYTSQTCSSCKHIGKRTNKVFKCTNTSCSVDVIDADFNACYNIAGLGVAINTPEKSTMFCSLHSLSGLKPILSL